jgi:hypothetical protein
MGSSAEIDKVSTAVSSDGSTISNFATNECNLEGVSAEESKGFILGQDETLKLLLGLLDFLGAIFNLLVVRLSEFAISGVRIVEETRVSRRSVSKVDSEFNFQTFSENVGTRMPEGLSSLGVIKSEHF